MVYLLIVILDDLRFLGPLLDAWRRIGVPGATIIESAGAHRVHSWLSKVGLAAIDHLFDSEDLQRRTLLTAIESEELLRKAVAEAERIVGDFDRPNTGVLLVLPVLQVSGIHKTRETRDGVPKAPGIRESWVARRDMPVEDVAAMFTVAPTIVQDDSSMDEVACAMMANPEVHVACVVAKDKRLVGLLDLQTISDYLFFYITPEEFLADISDLHDVERFAEKSRVRTVVDAMREPVWVKRGETVHDAFERMHTNHLTGIPLVDDAYRVIGFINLLELLSICSEQVGSPGRHGEDPTH